MKAVFALLALGLAFACALDDQDVLQQWTKFQADFGKSYRSPVEARKRFAIFQDNLNLIEAHNQLHKNGQSSFTMAVNQFADWTQSEFHSYVKNGLLNHTEALRKGETFVKSSNFVAPDSVDWRDQGVVTAVKDQGSCGGCWAFSSTGGLEGQLALKTGKLVSLSEQNLIDCSKGGNEGCNGGLMTYAFDYVKENGIDSEADYPFKERDQKCQAKNLTPVTKLSSYVNIREGDEEALTEAVATIGPICVGVNANMAFQFYSSGIFDSNCPGYSLNHAILVVGYGSENGKDFYIVKNSWNTSWGEKGYIRIARNKNKCGIANMATYPVL